MIRINRPTLAVAAFLMSATPAMAQMTGSNSWFVSPSIAMNAGGVTTESSPAVGLSGGWFSSGWLGAEAELAWTPGFFEQDGFLISRRVRTVMGNAIVRLTSAASSFQPFVAGGFGVVSPHLSDAGSLREAESNEAGFSAGTGVLWTKHNVGVRGDVRYFRTIGDDEVDAFGINYSKFDFWRVSSGLVVKF